MSGFPDQPSKRRRWKKKLLILLIVAGAIAYADYQRQLARLEGYYDRLEAIENGIKRQSADESSLNALSSSLRMIHDEMVTSSWRWISEGNKRLSDAIQKAQQQIEERKKSNAPRPSLSDPRTLR